MADSPDTIVAVHQPNFFPWLGYFDKLAAAHVFVLLDDVQFAKGGHGNWVNRVRILVNGLPTWSTVPVQRAERGLQTIRDIEIAAYDTWKNKFVNTVRANYCKSRYFDETMSYLLDLVDTPTPSLCEFNVKAITSLVRVLGCDGSRIIRQSDLAIAGQSTDLLIALVKAVGGTTYLCGDGSDGYLDEAAFGHAGVDLRFQRFHHPEYAQHGASGFIPGLSVLDALMQAGAGGVRAWLAQERDRREPVIQPVGWP